MTVKKANHKHNIEQRKISYYREFYCTICGEILFIGFHIPKYRGPKKISGDVPELSLDEKRKLV